MGRWAAATLLGSEMLSFWFSVVIILENGDFFFFFSGVSNGWRNEEANGVNPNTCHWLGCPERSCLGCPMEKVFLDKEAGALPRMFQRTEDRRSDP